MDWILSAWRLESDSGFANEIPFRDPGEWLASLAFRLKIIYRKNVALPIEQLHGVNCDGQPLKSIVWEQVIALRANLVDLVLSQFSPKYCVEFDTGIYDYF